MSANTQSQRDIADELREAQRELQRLTREVDRNSRKLKVTQERELKMLKAEDIAALLRVVLNDLKSSYALDSVSVVICDPNHDLRHLLLAGGHTVDDFSGLRFVDSLTGLAPQYIALRKPWLGQFSAADHSLILPQGGTIRSIAVLPLRHKGKLLGSINFGSNDESRFTSLHATDFFAHFSVIASFALENVVNRARLLRSGQTDFLTGWHNRRYLQFRLKEELARASREGSTLVCLMLDIDHFKRINDTYGHAAGDEVLREIAHRVETQVRASDVAARYGGEEFVVLLPATDSKSAQALAERIRTAISATPIAVNDDVAETITASIGIASCAAPTKGDDLKTLGESLLARADVALYQAKSAGRNRVEVG
ncbi:MAG: sensor domain-containing diguanylate cyclase [Woeseia sp.]|nr:sensor domain-containing diguanylate cyclase [Woeseia sp.]MBT8096920.1 sensor domain-containing diguanylate cyclase [Woeseia sp.]NNE61604.1 sensor domain-containing diguanylate cyclase [Woeseia sp.]NNL55475.1 sensor domain-containing diguanylate cyclase [Woeseia sp.]